MGRMKVPASWKFWTAPAGKKEMNVFQKVQFVTLLYRLTEEHAFELDKRVEEVDKAQQGQAIDITDDRAAPRSLDEYCRVMHVMQDPRAITARTRALGVLDRATLDANRSKTNENVRAAHNGWEALANFFNDRDIQYLNATEDPDLSARNVCASHCSPTAYANLFHINPNNEDIFENERDALWFQKTYGTIKKEGNKCKNRWQISGLQDGDLSTVAGTDDWIKFTDGNVAIMYLAFCWSKEDMGNLGKIFPMGWYTCDAGGQNLTADEMDDMMANHKRKVLVEMASARANAKKNRRKRSKVSSTSEGVGDSDDDSVVEFDYGGTVVNETEMRRKEYEMMDNLAQAVATNNREKTSQQSTITNHAEDKALLMFIATNGEDADKKSAMEALCTLAGFRAV